MSSVCLPKLAWSGHCALGAPIRLRRMPLVPAVRSQPPTMPTSSGAKTTTTGSRPEEPRCWMPAGDSPRAGLRLEAVASVHDQVAPSGEVGGGRGEIDHGAAQVLVGLAVPLDHPLIHPDGPDGGVVGARGIPGRTKVSRAN